MIAVRDALEKDTEAICRIFDATYGGMYCYREFVQPQQLKRLIFSDDTIVLVAEDEETNEVVGTASVLHEKGAYSDLVGEFGRLAVHPNARDRGVGRLLMKERLARIENRLHVGLVEARISHPYSTKISLKNGFAPVGFLPSKMLLEDRESVTPMVQFFGSALSLRRNHPRIIPEAYQLAHFALENCGITVDVIADDQAAPYPYCDEYTISQLTTEGYAGLLRIERGRVREREIYGPLRLHYGFFKLAAKNSHYLLAKQHEHVVGAIGYTVDPHSNAVRVFELISLDDEVIRFLLSTFIAKQKADDIVYIEVDVSAHAPRMQRTLLELGFVPAAYVPALAFDQVERIDLVKMVHLDAAARAYHPECEQSVREIAEVVLKMLASREVKPTMIRAVSNADLFSGMNEEQQRRLASYCRFEKFPDGELLFRQGEASGAIFVLVEGSISIQVGEAKRPIARISTGECLGEISALTDSVHSASALAVGEVQAVSLSVEDARQLIRRRPDIGVILYRNLAHTLSKRLAETDREFAQFSRQTHKE
jgi:ribosomal protein S18 acetylase RimI-like enzyme